MIRKIGDVLAREDRFLVVTHINPDGDAIGSLLGLHLALVEMGKISFALTRDRIPELYGFLPGASRIVTDTSRITEPPHWIVSLDVATESRISGDIAPFRKNARLVNIDHHPTNPGFGDLNLLEPAATSTAELVFRVLSAAGYRPSRDVGKCLFTGLIADTGCFRFAGVTDRTFKIGAALLEAGFDAYEVTRYLYEEYPIRRLHLERLMLERTEILLGGKLVISTLFAEDFQQLGAEFSDSEGLVDKLRDNQGVAAGVLMTLLSDNIVRVSFRSKDEVDVSAIAGLFGGGGHRRAAGLRSELPLSELKKRIVDAVEKSIYAK
ncbi:MAG: bifunctional oligoribonuclease/PAP phosphatase NrnA [Desulfomonile tiedjei]|nr:bifunctional oligoribonuclease/PAP phosphatase NrnA [Desulfomonile tiedjei]